MKISWKILQQFVKPSHRVSAKELAETLTMYTVEVDDYTDQSERLEGVVVGLVKKVYAHPNADKLKLATVDTGKETFEVVCGGVNLKEKMKVAFAKIGASVRWHGQGEWVKLEAAKIRGIQSNGMICAANELALEDPEFVEGGIMDITYLKAKPGTSLSEALGFTDILLDIDNKSITHRPDLWGHLGLARELAAVWALPFREPQPPAIKQSPEASLKVSVKAPERVHRYLGVIVGHIKVGPSPAWLVESLERLGVRAINNVVDVTNYCMLEFGQPLHAFDLSKLASAEIIVRDAKKGELLKTLDGLELKLEASTLVIADKKQAQAIAGVMGGAASEVSGTTTHIVLESATFEAVGVRQTAAALGLRTEASMRFEKALDPTLAEVALRRAVQLLTEVVPGARVLSNVADYYPKPVSPKPIELNLPWLAKRLGTELSLLKVQTILGGLGFKLAGKGHTLLVTPPSWRATRDITIPEDLIEEVARIYGYGKIPLAMPKFDITPPVVDEAQALRWKIRDLLVGAGWTETLSYSFVGTAAHGELELENPVDKTRQFLRPSLLASFKEQFEAARRAGSGTVKMFELGRVFKQAAGTFPVAGKGSVMLPAQPWHLVLAAYELDGRNFRVLKGAVQLMARELNLLSEPTYEFSQIANEGCLLEMTLDSFQAAPAREYRSLPKFPSVERDLSFIVRGASWSEVEPKIQDIDPLVDSVMGGIDVHEVKGAGTSTTARIVFRSPERTLKSEEVDALMKKITTLLQDKFNATIR